VRMLDLLADGLRRRASAGRDSVAAMSTDSDEVDARLRELGTWQAATLARLRDVVRGADPDIVEEIKWRKPSNPAGVPTWSCDGLICTGEMYKGWVKLTFTKGWELDDPAGLFNAGEGKRRAINVGEGEEVDAAALEALVREAIRVNRL
jgi:hypothetical protein